MIVYVPRQREIAERIPDVYLNPVEQYIENVLEHLYSEDYKYWKEYYHVIMLKKYYGYKIKDKSTCEILDNKRME